MSDQFDYLREAAGAMQAPPTPAPSGGDQYDYLRQAAGATAQPSTRPPLRPMTPDEETQFLAAAKAAGSTNQATIPQAAAAVGNRLNSMVRGGADILSMGTADRIAAGMGALTGVGGQRGDYAGNLAAQRQADMADPNARLAGQTIGALALPGAATTVPRAIGLGVAQGGAYGAGSSPDYTNVPQVAQNAATGAAIGGAAGALGQAGLSAITPMGSSAGRAAMVGTLQKEGVPLTAGQVSGSKPLQWAESAISDLPFAGGGAQKIEAAQQQAFTAAALKRAGIEAPLATPDVMAAGGEALGKKFDALSARNELKPDKQFGQDLSKALTEYNSKLGPANIAPGPKAVVDDLLSSAITGEAIPGDFYQATRSRLTNQAQAIRATDPPQAQAYRDIRNALDDAMERSIAANNPKDAGAWKQVRRQYANYQDIAQAVGAAGPAANSGIVTPANLRTALASGNNRKAYAKGQGDLAELAHAGVAVMTPMPNSGTAPRANIMSLARIGGEAAAGEYVGGPEGAIGAVAAPAILGRALMSKPVQGYLSNQVMTKLGSFARTREGARALAAAMTAKAIQGNQ